MQHRADQSPHRAGQIFRVRIQGHHIAIAPDQRRCAFALGRKGRQSIRLVQQQPVERHQRAAFAVFAHPARIPFPEGAGAVQIVILLSIRLPVQLFHAASGGGEYGFILRKLGRVRIPEIAQQQKINVRIPLQTAQRLHVGDHLPNARLAAEQHRQHHQRSGGIGHALQLQLQQPPRLHPAGMKATDQLHGAAPGQRQGIDPQNGYAHGAQQQCQHNRQRERNQRHGSVSRCIRNHAAQPARVPQLAAQLFASRILRQIPANGAARIMRAVFLKGGSGRTQGTAHHNALLQAQVAGQFRRIFPYAGL